MLICYLRIYGSAIDIKEMYGINAERHECERAMERERKRERKVEQASKQAKNKQNQNQRRQTKKNNNLWTNHSVHVAVWRHIEPLNYSAASVRLSFALGCSSHSFAIVYTDKCLVCMYLYNSTHTHTNAARFEWE